MDSYEQGCWGEQMGTPESSTSSKDVSNPTSLIFISFGPQIKFEVDQLFLGDHDFSPLALLGPNSTYLKVKCWGHARPRTNLKKGLSFQSLDHVLGEMSSWAQT